MISHNHCHPAIRPEYGMTRPVTTLAPVAPVVTSRGFGFRRGAVPKLLGGIVGLITGSGILDGLIILPKPYAYLTLSLFFGGTFAYLLLSEEILSP